MKAILFIIIILPFYFFLVKKKNCLLVIKAIPCRKVFDIQYCEECYEIYGCIWISNILKKKKN